MQTFLPHADFSKSVATLDRMRLGKQRVETFQTLQRLLGVRLTTWVWEDTGRVRRVSLSPEGTPEEEMEWEESPILRKRDLPKEEWQVERITTTGWLNHPVVKMWRGHELKLLEYQRATCEEWTSRGYKDTTLEKSEYLFEFFGGDRVQAATAPWWLGLEEFHLSHQSNLLRKTHEMTEAQEKQLGISRTHYDGYFPAVADDLPYYWPSHHEEDLEK